MDINPIAPGGLSGSAFNSTATGVAANVPASFGSPVVQSNDAFPAADARPSALMILRQEIQQVLAASFRIKAGTGLPAYSSVSEPATTDAVAGDAVTAGRMLAERAPLDASSNLVSLRSKLEQASEEVREIVGDDDDLDDVMERIGEEFDDLDDDAARNMPSSASVLSYESQLKQRSSIRIRTQEGDIVRFDLRRVEESSLRDVSMSDESGSFTSTEIEINSRTRTMLKVKGDLNEAEFAAIQSVFAQAESIANEFFNGDLAAAFDMAAGIEFDSEQLARVNLRFREKLETNVAYAAIGPVSAPAVAPAEPAAPVAAPAPALKPDPSIDPAPAPVLEPPATDEPVVVDTPVDAVAEDAPAGPALGDEAMDGFFDLLTRFLNGINEGFETAEGSLRYFYSQSFKLEILKSVMSFEAPEDAGNAANTAGTLIDSVTGSDDE